MRMTEDEKEHGVVVSLGCLAFCLLSMVLFTGKSFTHKAMDWTAWVLRLPEMPIVSIESQLSSIRFFFSERQKLLLELAALREENRELRIDLGEKAAEKKNSSVPAQ